MFEDYKSKGMDFSEKIGYGLILFNSISWSLYIIYQFFKYLERDGLEQSIKKIPFLGWSVGVGVIVFLNFSIGLFILIISTLVLLKIYFLEEYKDYKKNNKTKFFEVGDKIYHVQKVYDNNNILIEKSFNSREAAAMIAFKLNDNYSNLTFNIIDNTDKNDLFAKNKFQILATPK